MKLQDIEDTLNELLEADPDATDCLMQLGVHVNDNVADHPTIMVWSRSEDAALMLRVLGLLNGMISKSHPQRQIAAQYDEDTKELVGFKIIQAKEKE